MNWLKKPFYIGSLELPNNIFYSPLAGCSDYPFRLMSAKYKPGLQFCEMVKMEALIRYDRQTYRILDYDKSMHPHGAQIVGGNPQNAYISAKIIEDLGFDLIDLNCGCPVDKVTRDGSGSGMLRNPSRIGEVVAEMVRAVRIPVTLKIRAGWDQSQINALEIAQVAKEAGAKAIFIHGRTRAQGYKGPADWQVIREVKQAMPDFLVFGNGDVFDPESCLRMFETTKCDGALVSRGTMGAPWAAHWMCAFLRGEGYSLDETEAAWSHLREHFSHVVDYQQDKKALLDLRRLACWYLKKLPEAKQEKVSLSKVSAMEDALALLSRSS